MSIINGCRVYRQSDSNKKIVGKIIGGHNEFSATYRGGSNSSLMLSILTPEGEIIVLGYNGVRIVSEDMEILYRELKAEPIESRSEILDL